MKDATEMTRKQVEHEIKRIDAYLDDLRNHPFRDEHASAEIAGDRLDYLMNALREGSYKSVNPFDQRARRYRVTRKLQEM